MKTTIELKKITRKIILIIGCLIIVNLIFGENLLNDLNKSTAYYSLKTMSFVENTGQFPQECSYFARSASAFIYIMNNGDIVYSSIGKGEALLTEDNLIEHFEGNKDNRIIPISKNSTFVNEFYKEENTVKHYKSQKFESLLFKDVFKGISMDMVVRESTIEKRFFVSALSDPDQILISVTGSTPVINESGELVLESNGRQIKYSKPFALQNIDGVKQIIDISYKLHENSYGFEVGNYDNTKELIIDPLLGGTFFGKEDGVELVAMDIDNQGNIFVTGSVLWPPDANDVVVLKFNNDLTVLLGEAYIYGSDNEKGMGIKVDPAGNIFVAGNTQSSDFPTVQGSFDVTHNDSLDIFISKISSDFEYLLGSTFVGGSWEEARYGLNLDIAPNGDIVISAGVDSHDMPIFGNPFQATNAGYDDVYIARLNNDLTTMIASSYLGGMYSDGAFALKVGTNGDIYVSGFTWSSNFPHTEGSFHGGGTDAYITQINSSLSQIEKSLFLGGTNGTWEYGCDISQNNLGQIILAGATIATDFEPITAGAFQPNNGGNTDMFITKFDQNLNVLKSTFFGGLWDEGAFSIVSCDVGSSNEIYIAGATYSTENQNFPILVNGFDIDHNGNGDGFVSLLNSDLSTLFASTYYGGIDYDCVNDLKVDNSGYVFICGTTHSANLPIPPNGYMPNKSNAINDGFVAKFDPYLTAGILGIPDQAVTQSNEVNLQVFPNPCKIETTISFTVVERAEVIVKVVDLVGKTIAVPIHNILYEGDYQYNILLADYKIDPNQIYLIVIEIKNQDHILTGQKKIVVYE